MVACAAADGQGRGARGGRNGADAAKTAAVGVAGARKGVRKVKFFWP